MTDKPRIRRSFPKMPDIKITDLVENPPPVATERPTGLSRRGESTLSEEPLSLRYEGTVTAAIGVWQPNANGKITKYYDTRVRYENAAGVQFLQMVLPLSQHIAVKSRVTVEERSGKIRVITGTRNPAPAAGSTWSKPDIKSASIVMGLIIGIALIISLISWSITKSNEKEQKPVQTPALEITASLDIPTDNLSNLPGSSNNPESTQPSGTP